MSHPRRNTVSKFSTSNPQRFTHYTTTSGKVVKPAKRERAIDLRAMGRRDAELDARREDDGDILYA